MNTVKNIVVIGGGYAGVNSALRLSKHLKPDQATITLVDGTDHFVERIRFHQLSSGQSLPHYAYADFLDGTDVQFLQGWVTGISPDKQRLTVHRGKQDVTLSYDFLVYALGSLIDTKVVPGINEYAMSVSTEASTLALREKLVSLLSQGKVVICGGGLTAIESATEYAESYPHLDVTVITQGKLGERLSAKAQAYLKGKFETFGIRLLEDATITEIVEGQVLYNQGQAIDYDVCIWAGAFTVPKLAQHSGLPVNHAGQIRVDQQLRVQGHDTIFAIGDSATLEETLDFPIRMACATAVPMGGFVADQIAAQIQSKPPKPYQFRYYIQCISLGRHDGLIQVVEPDDTPTKRVISGRLGKIIKEVICRYTIWVMKWERFGARLANRSGTFQPQSPALKEA